MNTHIKTTFAVAVSTALVLGASLVPATASARPSYNNSYVCQVEKKEKARNGMIIGAIAGGLLGSQVSKNEKGLGALGGAVIGGVVGKNLGEDHGKGNCKKIAAQARDMYGSYNPRTGHTTYRYDDRRSDRGYDYR